MSKNSRNKLQIWGHRGCRCGKGFPPENTIAAFKEAIRQGANGIEFDLFLTADGKVVVFHDDTLSKLTNGRGKTKQMTLAELKQLRVMGVTQEPIPTFEELLAAIGPRKGFTYNIEIKDIDAMDAAAKIVRKALRNGFKKEHFLISCFNRKALARMVKMLPGIRFGALYDKREKLQKLPYKPYAALFVLQRFNEKLVEAIRAEGMVPMAWTSRELSPTKNPDLWRVRAFDLVLITDFPAEARKALN